MKGALSHGRMGKGVRRQTEGERGGGKKCHMMGSVRFSP